MARVDVTVATRESYDVQVAMGNGGLYPTTGRVAAGSLVIVGVPDALDHLAATLTEAARMARAAGT